MNPIEWNRGFLYKPLLALVRLLMVGSLFLCLSSCYLLGMEPQAKPPELKGPKWGDAITALAQTITRQLKWNQRRPMKIAILDFTSASGGACSLGGPLSEDLTTKLFNAKSFSIIERRMLDRVMAENQVVQSDLFDPGQVAKLGRLCARVAGFGSVVIVILSGLQGLRRWIP